MIGHQKRCSFICFIASQNNSTNRDNRCKLEEGHDGDHTLIHTKREAVNVLVALGDKGIQGEVIGTLPSNHDIDIFIVKPEDNPELRAKILSILKPKNWKSTDWNGMFLYETEFGNIDIFFEKPPRSPIPC